MYSSTLHKCTPATLDNLAYDTPSEAPSGISGKCVVDDSEDVAAADDDDCTLADWRDERNLLFFFTSHCIGNLLIILYSTLYVLSFLLATDVGVVCSYRTYLQEEVNINPIWPHR